MLVPCVARYVVTPPSASGQKSQTAASISAANALMLAALVAASMAKAPVRVGRGGRSDSPARSAEGLRAADGQADGLELVEERAVALAGDQLGGGDPGDRARVVGGRGQRVLERHGRRHTGEGGCVVRGEDDVVQYTVVRGEPVVSDRGHVDAGDGDLAVTDDARGLVEGVTGGEGGGGDAGSGNRNTGEQNARLAHCLG